VWKKQRSIAPSAYASSAAAAKNHALLTFKMLDEHPEIHFPENS
jgi:hypothetical protein